MSEYIDYISMPMEQLDARGKELAAKIREGYLSDERKAQVQHEISNISFELWCRYNEGDIQFVPTD